MDVAPLTGQIIKGYELYERIGVGGFGAVYRAHQATIDREVAIKVILPQYANQPDFILRFEAEAQLVARLEHMNIVPLYDYWRDPGGAYLVMRYLRGGSLRNALNQGPLAAEVVVHLIDQIGAALASAHRHGVIHRDLKPDNILLDEDGNAYLADFGIAKSLIGDQRDHKISGVVGSPAYITPEQIRAEPVTPQTDIYSLGVMIYELLTGENPFPSDLPLGVLILKQLNEAIPPLSLRRPDLPAAADKVIQKATAKIPAERYADALTLALEFRRAILAGAAEAETLSEDEIIVLDEDVSGEGHDQLVAEIVTVRLENPYKGLRAFQEADEADFFGRENLTAQLIARLQEPDPAARFLAVVGPSGSGKSSVVRAGLIPALRRGVLPGSERWYKVEMIPGAHPLEELEAALMRVAVNPPDSLASLMREDENGLLRAVKRVLPGDDKAVLLLVIDQFEEVFTQLDDEPARKHFLDSLLAAVEQPDSPLRIVVTLRADFYDRPLNYPAFGDLMRRRTEVVLPMSAEELERAITAPANRVGLNLESGLAMAIIKDVGEQPGTLPLLQYALTELFERRQNLTLTLEAYQRSGGVLGALARRAEELYNGMNADDQAAVRQLFLRLVTLGEGVEDTRRRVRRSELTSITGTSATINAVIDRYGKFRLLTLDRDPATRAPTVEVAHEALIRTWTRLRGWLAESREVVRLQRLVQSAANDWINENREGSFLATGARLTQFESLLSGGAIALNDVEIDYIRASVEERERQENAERVRQEHELKLAQESAEAARRAATAQRTAARRLRLLVWVMAAFILVGVGLLIVAIKNQQDAARSAAEAAQNANAAATAQGRAEAQSALAEVQRLAAEAQRLAAEASMLIPGGGNNAELAVLLAIRSLKTSYSLQADQALIQSIGLVYTRQIYTGHTGPVYAVTLSPDGTTVLTGGDDKTARLWDVDTGKPVGLPLVGHDGAVRAVAFSPDGKTILTGGEDNMAILWNADTGDEIGTFGGHTGTIYSVAFSSDGKKALTASADKTARLWDVTTQSTILTFTGHTDELNSAVFSPDDKYVLTASDDGSAILWDAATAQQVRTFTAPAQGAFRVLRAVFSPDGTRVLTANSDGTAALWDATRDKDNQLRVIPANSGQVYSVAFSPDGKLILTAGGDGTAQLWDAETGAPMRRLTGHDGAIRAVAFSPSGKQILTASEDETARLWDDGLGNEPHRLVGHTAAVTQAVYSADGTQIVTISPADSAGSVRVWDAASGAQKYNLKLDVSSIALSPDGKWLATGGNKGQVSMWTLDGVLRRVKFAGHGRSVLAIAFSPDGTKLLSGSADGTARLWDVTTGKALLPPFTHNGPVNSVAFSADDKRIATGSFNFDGSDGYVEIWDAATGTMLKGFSGNGGSVNSVAFSPDGSQVLAGLSNGLAIAWDTNLGIPLHRFAGHSGSVNSVAYSLPDGKFILTGSDDGTARLWDATTGETTRIFTGHMGRVTRVAFAPNGKQFLTAGEDHSVRLWDTDYTDLIAFACTRVFRDFKQDERDRYLAGSSDTTCPQFAAATGPSVPPLTTPTAAPVGQ